MTLARPRAIAIEEHFSTPALIARRPQQVEAAVRERLCDLGERRLAEMDEAGIDVQVVSLAAPGTEALEPDDAAAVAREVNDAVGAATRDHPTRLAAFATLPTPAPDRAAAELERACRELGMKGALINGHVRGRRLDDGFFWPILESAEALGVPLYLHPAIPPRPVVDALYSGFAPDVSAALSSWAWGWHIETAIHVLRIVVSGAFDRFPKLQLIIGHMGETLPFMLERFRRLSRETTGLEREVPDYLRENVHYTFGGFNWTSTFLNLVQEVGVDRIMFSTDYPWAPMSEGRSFLDRLPVSDADRARIAHGNAEALLRL